jgi:radical SAM protein with 4Fe4S-binding SPASM domain
MERFDVRVMAGKSVSMISKIKKIFKSSPRLYRIAQQYYPFVTLLKGILCRKRGSLDHLHSTWSLLWRSSFVAGRPVNITIEPTNTCNLRCPVCETGAGKLGRPGKQMTLAEFRTIIEKIAVHTNTLMFYFMGEPFLNNEAYGMIQIAKKAGIPWVTTCTNGEALDPEKLVMSGIDEVNFQLGGISQKTHETYRINGNLEKVLFNIKEVVRLKRERKTGPRIVCGMILMRHNEHETEAFCKNVKKLGADEALIIDPCVRTIEQGRSYLPKDEKRWYYDVKAFRLGVLRPQFIPKNFCQWIYYSAVILANGDVVPCCRDAKGEHVMGNLLSQSFKDIWNAGPYRAFRRKLFADQSEMNICRLCSGYPASSLK